MSDKKKLSTEELIRIASKPLGKETKSSSNYSEAHQMILHYDLEPGKNKVPASFLYKLYHQFKDGEALQGKAKFFREFAEFFERYSNGKTVYYLLSVSATKLSRRHETNE